MYRCISLDSSVSSSSSRCFTLFSVHIYISFVVQGTLLHAAETLNDDEEEEEEEEEDDGILDTSLSRPSFLASSPLASSPLVSSPLVSSCRSLLV
jgi:hypothetical protein